MSGDHYFAAEPTAPSRPRQVTLVTSDLTVTLDTDAGVFSADRVDPATRLLLAVTADSTEQPRNVLDLGCGYGPIAVTLAMRFPDATVWATDTNARAVDLCEANARSHGLENLRAMLVDAAAPFAALPDDLRFDGIWSNPPVRIGKSAMTALVEQACSLLTPEGEAHVVISRHLGGDSLHRALSTAGWDVARVASRQGLRVLRVTHNPSSPGEPQ